MCAAVGVACAETPGSAMNGRGIKGGKVRATRDLFGADLTDALTAARAELILASCLTASSNVLGHKIAICYLLRETCWNSVASQSLQVMQRSVSLLLGYLS